MAESTPNADATSDAGATPAGVADAVPAPADDATLGDAGKRTISELRRELKEVRAERDTFLAEKRAADDADRSELEKMTRERDELVPLRSQVQKMQAAIEAGIPDQWMRLNGTTPDELKADAKQFAESLGKTGDGGNGATPADLGAGPRPNAPATGSAGFSATLRERARR